MRDSSENISSNEAIFQTQETDVRYVSRVSPGEFRVTKKDTWKNKSLEKIKQDYHEQRLAQSKWAFWLSFWGSIFGFVVIVFSIGYGIIIGESEWPGIVSGIVIEAVSALFYGMTNRANEKISEFFRELTKESNVLEALKLAGKIEDSDIADELRVKLSLHLSGIDEDKICKNTKDVCENHNKTS